jgi:uncharacterized Zn finger protein
MDSYNSEREWWVQQWLDLLDKYRFKKRLERGRNYARQGNVLDINFQGDRIVSRVQGTEEEPYQQSLWVDIFSNEDWDCIIQTLSEQAIFSAKLMAGEMPQNIEDVFAANGLRLFPFNLTEIRSRCSCPDKANPCKHIIAVYHLLGDRFAEDPFLLFQLRGRTKEDLIDALRQRRLGAGDEAMSSSSNNLETVSATVSLSTQLETFWEFARQLDPSLVAIVPPPNSETILDVLGFISLPQDGKPESKNRTSVSSDRAMQDYLQQVYQTVSQQALLSAMAREQ